MAVHQGVGEGVTSNSWNSSTRNPDSSTADSTSPSEWSFSQALCVRVSGNGVATTALGALHTTCTFPLRSI